MIKSPKITNRLPLYTLIIVLVLLSLGVGYLLDQTNDYNTQLKNLDKQKESTQAQVRLLQSEINLLKSSQQPVILAKEKLVVFPELSIALPYNDVTKTLQYTTDGKDMRVTSTLLTDYKERQMSCSELVRINMRDGSAYNPWEEAMGSVALSDGRTQHIIASKAFKNNEASTEECAKEVWTQITPRQVANEFKKAIAY